MGGAGSHAAVGVARDDSISTIARRIDRPSAASVPNPSLSRRGCATPLAETGQTRPSRRATFVITPGGYEGRAACRV